MTWQENVELIIMLCRTVEDGKPKCSQYWPKTPGQTATYCGIAIKNVEVNFFTNKQFHEDHIHLGEALERGMHRRDKFSTNERIFANKILILYGSDDHIQS